MQQNRNRNYGNRNSNNRNRNNNNRNRNNNRNGGGNKRFNVKQVENKRDNYINLHKEHLRADRVKAEYYLQHADHFQRLLNEHEEMMEAQRAANPEPEIEAVEGDVEVGEIISESEGVEEGAVETVVEEKPKRRTRAKKATPKVEEIGDDAVESDAGADLGNALPDAIAT